MSMTVARLHKLLGDLVKNGHGRKPLLVNKPSFSHPCESDGAVLLGISGISEPRWIPMVADDGGTKWRKDGYEAGKHAVLLFGATGDTP